METASEQWASEEFGHAALGHGHRTKRLVKMAAKAAQRPAGKVTGVFDTSREREGAFRWVENPEVDVEAVARASHEAAARRCAEPWMFVAVDQSALSLTDRTGRKGLGRVGVIESLRARGMQVMSALAVSQQGTPLGLVGQCWRRRPEQHSPTQKQDRRPLEQRESVLWRQTLEQTEELLQRQDCRAWYQLDRGGDTWHVLQYATEHELWLTTRAAYNRRLQSPQDSPEYLWPRLKEQAVAARYDAYLSPHAARRSGHQPERARRLTIRFAPVTLQLREFQRRQSPVQLYAVYVRETTPPRSAQRIEWMLLSTYPVRTAQDARLVVHGYVQRWKIEEFHRTWKSGRCRVEESQLRSKNAFLRWATVLAAVATRIERLKHLARSQPQMPACEQLSRHEIDAAIVLSQTRNHQLGDSITLHQAVQLIAHVGGYTGKSSGRPPGSITIGRGLLEVLAAAKAFAFLADRESG